jgi:hypothetical protein
MLACEYFRSWIFDVQEKQMIDDLAVEEVRAPLKLEPHATCQGLAAEYPDVAADLRVWSG